MPRSSPVFLLVSLLMLVGCGEVRSPTPNRPAVKPTYVGQVKALLARRCVSCHGADKPAGSYDLSSYVGLLGPGSDGTVRNAIAGDGTSRLLLKLAKVNDPKHWDYLLPKSSEELAPGESAEGRREADFELLKAWVLRERLAYFDVGVHPPSWVYPGDRNSAEFHGGALRSRGWDLAACQGCHGQDLKGDPARGGGSCYACHDSGPTACTTCHGSSERTGQAAIAPPADLSWELSPTKRGVGAHQAHLRSRAWWAPISCGDCHTVPSRLDSPGHLFDEGAGKSSDLRAELTFGSRAALDGVTPSLDSKSGQCTVYCHGASFLSIGQGSTPAWTATGAGKCGSCHLVPAVAGGPDCSTCHPQSVERCTYDGTDATCLPTDAQAGIGTRFLDPAFHGDGKYPLGKKGDEGTCYGCHGTQASGGAPPPDLRGNTDISAVGVGLHATHLSAGSFANAVACEACHKVPTKLQDAGHFEDDLPAEVTFSDLAQGKLQAPSGGKSPVWDRTKATCSDTWCHGLSGGKVTDWTWTKKLASPLACDSCHGLPPTETTSSGSHPVVPSTGCDSCHGAAYSGGSLDPAKHINGKVDL
jgi:predicted CxxxxCH...CXXCH cytochrome family protein